MHTRFALTAIVVSSAMALVACPAHADPQISGGLTTGVAVTDLRTRTHPGAAYTLGARFDVLLGRSSPRDMAIGPYLEVLTTAFDAIEGGGGVAWLIPSGATGFVLSAGAFARSAGFGVEPGAAGTLYWGSRSFNYHSAYSPSVGLFAQGRYGLGDDGTGKQADVLLGVQIDLEYLALPFVFAYAAVAR